MTRFHKTMTAIIVGLWVVMSVGVLWLLPLGDGRDEMYHLQHVEFYAQEKRLPLVPDDYHNRLTSVQVHQPPLYYAALAALIVAGAPTPESMSYYLPNELGGPPLQTWDSHFESPVVTWFLMRVVSWLFTCIGIYAVYRSAVLLFGDEIPAAVPLTMAFLLFAPGLIISASTISNNVLVFTSAALIGDHYEIAPP